MEYSKEDLMEAKKQILGVGENMGTEESKKIWEENGVISDTESSVESRIRKPASKRGRRTAREGTEKRKALHAPHK